MKTLFIGGIKSGKSLNAQNYTLKHSLQKPIYLATTEFVDEQMQERIDAHKKNRKESFVTMEEPLYLYEIIKDASSAVLVECVSMWINNMLYHNFSYEDIKKETKSILKLKKDVVFVVNDVSASVVSANRLVRDFVDINGKISQQIASECDEVYHVVAGIAVRIK